MSNNLSEICGLRKKFFYKILPATYIHDLFVYYDEEFHETGTLCLINFHGRKILGVIFGFCSEKEIKDILNKKIAIKKIELIFSLLPKFSLQYLEFIEKIAYFEIESPGFVLKTMTSVLSSQMKFFLDKGKIEKILKVYESDQKNLKKIENSAILNPNQKDVYEEFFKINKSQSSSFDEQNSRIFLLEGETGSGKTEVYLEIIKDFLNQDKENQVLIVLPEIALTNAVLERISKRLSGVSPISFHHNLTLAKKRDAFLLAFFGAGRVFVGARSAIFLPFKKLSLIVVDEEHDQSFKQEQGLIYHLIDLAFLKLEIEKKSLKAVILASATPSLETIFLVKQKKIHRLFLKSQKTLEERMKIEIIDMREMVFKKDLNETKNLYRSIVSDELLDRIKETLKNGLQSMIFLNRRGYNHLIICKNCKNKLLCGNCSVGLVFHKEIQKFYCHYCGFSKDVSKTSCSICLDSSKGFKFLGFGVEKIFEILKENFSESKILLLSSDLLNNEKILETIKQIESGDANIIVGTQILAKGHNFPKLGFLGVIDGGLNFSGIDLRSSEKTYQILHQILGRIGRFDFPGNVMIQTYEPKNLILQALINFNKTEFYNSEFKQRKLFEMPPFFSLIKVSFSGFFKEAVQIEANKFAGLLPLNPEVKILGPSPSSIFKMNKKYRFNVFLQSKKTFNLHDFLISGLKNMNFNKKIIMKIDVNPMNFI